MVRNVWNRLFSVVLCAVLVCTLVPAVALAKGSDETFNQQSFSTQSTTDFEYSVYDGKATITSYNGSATDVVIPSKIDTYFVTKVGNSAFRGNTTLTSIEFPYTLQDIGHSAFKGCTGLTTLELPENLQGIGERAFEDCLSLESLVVNCVNLDLYSDGFVWLEGPFANAGSVGSGIEVTFTSTCKKVPASLSLSNDDGQGPNFVKATISSSVTSIGEGAFEDCGTLSSVVFEGDGLLSIGKSAFRGCSSLTAIDFPETIREIHASAFKGCTGLESIVLPANLQYLSELVFEDCFSLRSITIDSSNLSMSYDNYSVNSTFDYAGTLTDGIEVVFGPTCKKIPSNLFLTSEKTSPKIIKVTIPSAVTTIEEDAFRDLSGYTIYGYTYSTAWEYATENNIPFVSLGVLTIDNPIDNTDEGSDERTDETTQTMYRLYNPNSGEHFYTADTNERRNLIRLGWKDEGTGWIAPTTGDPVYRLYNPYAGEHHYTTNASEKNMLVRAGWKNEGVGWYSGGNVRLYREYNPNAYANNHNYTTSESEHNWLLSLGWKDEGYAWNAVAAG